MRSIITIFTRCQDEASLILLLAVIIVICLIAGINGNFPINDDMLYAESVRHIVEQGKFFSYGSNAFDFIPIQMASLICTALGFSYNYLRVLTICFHIFGSLGLYLGLREINLSKKASVFMTALYTCNPFCINLALTFMTDIPALALNNWLFYLSVKAIKKQTLSTWLLALCSFLAAISIRQTALLFIVPLLTSICFSQMSKVKKIFLLILSLFSTIIVYSLLNQWLISGSECSSVYTNFQSVLFQQLFGIVEKPIGFFLQLINTFAKGLCYSSLMLAPLIVVLSIKILSNSRKYVSIIMISMLLSILCVGLPLAINIFVKHQYMPYSLNLFMPPFLGAYQIIGGFFSWQEKHLFTLTIISGVFALIMGFCICVALILQMKEKELFSKPNLFINITLCLSAAYLAIQLPMHNLDRYYLFSLAPLILFFGLVCNTLNMDKLVLLGLILFVPLVLYGTFAAKDSMDFHRAQWQAIKELEAMGVSPLEIDGGANHNLFHGGLKLTLGFKKTATEHGWPKEFRGGEPRCHLRWWPINKETYIVAAISLPNCKIVKTIPNWSVIRGRQRNIYVLSPISAHNQ